VLSLSVLISLGEDRIHRYLILNRCRLLLAQLGLHSWHGRDRHVLGGGSGSLLGDRRHHHVGHLGLTESGEWCGVYVDALLGLVLFCLVRLLWVIINCFITTYLLVGVLVALVGSGLVVLSRTLLILLLRLIFLLVKVLLLFIATIVVSVVVRKFTHLLRGVLGEIVLAVIITRCSILVVLLRPTLLIVLLICWLVAGILLLIATLWCLVLVLASSASSMRVLSALTASTSELLHKSV
jgi:hypothetical protein